MKRPEYAKLTFTEFCLLAAFLAVALTLRQLDVMRGWEPGEPCDAAAYGGCTQADFEFVAPALVPIAREACRRRSRTTQNLFVTTYHGEDSAIKNWFLGLTRHGIDEVLIVAMDNDGQEQLTKMGLPSVMYNGTGEPEDVAAERLAGYQERVEQASPYAERSSIESWVRRMDFSNERTQIVNAILQTGTTVTVADIDAVTKRDPRPYMEQNLREHDIVACQETWPFGADSEIGTSVLMGYVTLKASAKMKRFMRERVLPAVDEVGDDQMGMNHAIHRDEVVRNVGLGRSAKSGDKTVNVRTTGYDIKVLYVPTEIYVRHCSKEDKSVLDEATVLYCVKEKNLPMEMAKRYSNLFLPDGEDVGLVTSARLVRQRGAHAHSVPPAEQPQPEA
eukprot:CAMPEP_0198727372 /NCGR_PEP_ID=MMETSP1475-20131203/4122_1 /TAXON_ID= ORGANISM="Unidentified sp., Strain CCMP1999" /NCGR_SAMPLE_ID=MMETSP1475 /ASSEMBLY_ACC=CAM_ASM_001111 /LENGTH=389 /DNA_ID=CAMNT_0044489407 /DNA_START=42 /DNA_END=1211 /DNA_ORIENTATION=-